MSNGAVPPGAPGRPARPFLRELLSVAVAVGLAFIAARYGITIPPPAPPPQIIVQPPAPGELQPPRADPPAPIVIPQPMPNPAAAIVRLSSGNVGCTGTIIGPRRPDGRYWLLTASHCVDRVGQHWTARLLDGRATGCVVASFDRKADAAWLYTETNSVEFPYAFLAVSSPPVGTPVWHAGYGVDKPGNRELGKVTGLPDSNGQLRFTLSVSSGDSGGGIMHNERGEVVSCVCCTSERGRVGATTWGTSPEAALKARPPLTVSDEWQPIELPVRPLPPS